MPVLSSVDRPFAEPSGGRTTAGRLRALAPVGSSAAGAAAVFVAKLLFVALQFAVTLVLAHALNKSEFGTYAFYMALVSLAGSIGVFGLDKLAVKERISVDRIRYVAHCVVIGGVVLSIFALFTLLPSGAPVETSLVFEVFGCALLLAMLRLYSGYLRSEGRFFESEFVGSALRLLLLLAAVLVLIGIEATGVPNVLRAVALASFGAVAVAAFVFGFSSSPEADTSLRASVVGTLRSSFVFFLFSIATSAQAYADIVILGLVSSEVAVAEYSIALRIASFLVFGTVAINVVIGPRIARAYREDRISSVAPLAKRSARYGASFSAAVGLPLFVFAEPVLSLFGAEYAVASTALRIVVVAQMLSAAFGPVNQLCLYAGGAYVSTAVIALAVVVNTVANVMLAPEFGSAGAAWSLLLSFVIWNLSLFVFLKVRHGIDASIL